MPRLDGVPLVHRMAANTEVILGRPQHFAALGRVAGGAAHGSRQVALSPQDFSYR
jgi:hypothetical protein